MRRTPHIPQPHDVRSSFGPVSLAIGNCHLIDAPRLSRMYRIPMFVTPGRPPVQLAPSTFSQPRNSVQ